MCMLYLMKLSLFENLREDNKSLFGFFVSYEHETECA